MQSTARLFPTILAAAGGYLLAKQEYVGAVAVLIAAIALIMRDRSERFSLGMELAQLVNMDTAAYGAVDDISDGTLSLVNYLESEPDIKWRLTFPRVPGKSPSPFWRDEEKKQAFEEVVREYMGLMGSSKAVTQAAVTALFGVYQKRILAGYKSNEITKKIVLVASAASIITTMSIDGCDDGGVTSFRDGVDQMAQMDDAISTSLLDKLYTDEIVTRALKLVCDHKAEKFADIPASELLSV